jgi:hypothetical protein
MKDNSRRFQKTPHRSVGQLGIIVGGPLAHRHLILLPTIYTVDSKAVLRWFIQQWLREVTQSMMWQFLALYSISHIYTSPCPPSLELSLKP